MRLNDRTYNAQLVWAEKKKSSFPETPHLMLFSLHSLAAFKSQFGFLILQMIVIGIIFKVGLP